MSSERLPAIPRSREPVAWIDSDRDDMSVVNVTIGAALLIGDAVRLATRPLDRLARPFGRRAERWLRPLAVRGGQEVRLALHRADEVADAAFPAFVNYVVAHLDLTELVDDNLDLDRLVTQVIADIDLAGIIRESSVAVTSEAVRGVRSQGIEADQAVARVVDRVLRRRRAALDPPDELAAAEQPPVLERHPIPEQLPVLEQP
jgi:hypothetical protein